MDNSPRVFTALGPVRFTPIYGDGDCLFRALAHQLNPHLSPASPLISAATLDLRRAAVGYIHVNMALFRHSLEDALTDPQLEAAFGTPPPTTPEEIVARLAQPGTWGGEECILAAASVLKRVIVVHQREGQPQIYFPAGAQTAAEGDRLHIVRHNVNNIMTGPLNHFSSVVGPPPTPPTPPPSPTTASSCATAGTESDSAVLTAVSTPATETLTAPTGTGTGPRLSDGPPLHSAATTRATPTSGSRYGSQASDADRHPREHRFATWNVRGCAQADKRALVDQALHDKGITIAAVQETRMPAGEANTTHYHWHLEGTHSAGAGRGLAFLIHHSATRLTIHSVEFPGANVGVLTATYCGLRLTFINTHVPSDRRQQATTRRLTAAVMHAPSTSFTILLGDLNGHLGQDAIRPSDVEYVGTSLFHDDTNPAGLALLTVARARQLFIWTTHNTKARHTRTTFRRGNAEAQLDHIATDYRLVRAVHGWWAPAVPTDHKIISISIKLGAHAGPLATRDASSGPSHANKGRMWNFSLLRSKTGKEAYHKATDAYLELAREAHQNAAQRRQQGARARGPPLQPTPHSPTPPPALPCTPPANLNAPPSPQPLPWDRVAAVIQSAANATLRQEHSPLTPRRREALDALAHRKAELRRRPGAHPDDPPAIAVRQASAALQAARRVHDLDKTAAFFASLGDNPAQSQVHQAFRHIRKARRRRPGADAPIGIRAFDEAIRPMQRPLPALLPEDPADAALYPPPTAEQVRYYIAQLSGGKTPGTDRLPAELFMAASDELIQDITNTIAEAWVTGVFPDSWTRTSQIPIPKVPRPQDVKDYRRLTMCNVAYKVASRHVLNLAERSNIHLPDYQAAGRHERSACDHLFTTRRVLDTRWNEGRPVHVLSLDLNKAFDTVDLHVLTGVLREDGLRPYLINRIINLIFKERTSVSWQGRRTTTYTKGVGVKQGCSYSPWLFNRAIHHAIRLVAAALPHLHLLDDNDNMLPLLLAFADDILIIAEDAATIALILDHLIPALASIGLQFNMQKCALVIRQPGQAAEDLPRMVPVGPYQFQEVRSFRYLGTTISNTLDRAGQVHRRVAAATRTAHFLAGFIRTNPMPWPFVVRLYKIILQPGLLFDLNTAALTQRSRHQLHTAERLHITTLATAARQNINNISIRALLRNRTITAQTRARRLTYHGHIERAGARTLLGRSRRLAVRHRRVGRPCFTWADSLREDMAKMRVTHEDIRPLLPHKDRMRRYATEMAAHGDTTDSEDPDTTLPPLRFPPEWFQEEDQSGPEEDGPEGEQ